ncbi:MAG: OsmC family protein [Deltaproteobacteria bacterium]|nr:OsmC family protein [Deltaproteobacteria bacterium]
MDMEIVFTGGKKVEARWRGFTIQTDQGPDHGGEGSAPEPFTLFLASLGTCAGIYVLSFCEARGIPTEGLRLIQHMVTAPDNQGLGGIEMEVVLPPEFPAKYEKAVLRVAEQCAVKKALISPPPITWKASRE